MPSKVWFLSFSNETTIQTSDSNETETQTLGRRLGRNKTNKVPSSLEPFKAQMRSFQNKFKVLNKIILLKNSRKGLIFMVS